MSSLLLTRKPWLLTFVLAQTKPETLMAINELLPDEFNSLQEQIAPLLPTGMQILYTNPSSSTLTDKRPPPTRIAQIISFTQSSNFSNTSGPVECELSDGKHFMRAFLTADAIQSALKGPFEGRTIRSQKGSIITIKRYRIVAVKATINGSTGDGGGETERYKVGLRLIVEGFSITGAEGCGTVGTPEYCGNYKTCLLQLEQRIQQDFIASNDAIDKQCEDDPSPSTQANVSQESSDLDGLHLIIEQFSQTQQPPAASTTGNEKQSFTTCAPISEEPDSNPWKDFLINNEVLRLAEEAALLASSLPFYQPRFPHLLLEQQPQPAQQTSKADENCEMAAEQSAPHDIFVQEPITDFIASASPPRQQSSEQILCDLIVCQDSLDLQDIDSDDNSDEENNCHLDAAQNSTPLIDAVDDPIEASSVRQRTSSPDLLLADDYVLTDNEQPIDDDNNSSAPLPSFIRNHPREPSHDGNLQFKQRQQEQQQQQSSTLLPQSYVVIESSCEGKQLLRSGADEISQIPHESGSNNQLITPSLPQNYPSVSFVGETPSISRSLAVKDTPLLPESPGIFRRSIDFIRSFVRNAISSPVAAGGSTESQKNADKTPIYLVPDSTGCDGDYSASGQQQHQQQQQHLLMETPVAVKSSSSSSAVDGTNTTCFVPATQDSPEMISSFNHRSLEKPFISALPPNEPKSIEIVLGPISSKLKRQRSPPQPLFDPIVNSDDDYSPKRPIVKRQRTAVTTLLSSSPDQQASPLSFRIPYRQFPDAELSASSFLSTAFVADVASQFVPSSQHSVDFIVSDSSQQEDNDRESTATASTHMNQEISSFVPCSQEADIELTASALTASAAAILNSSSNQSEPSANDRRSSYFMEFVTGEETDEFRIRTISSHSTSNPSVDNNSFDSTGTTSRTSFTATNTTSTTTTTTTAATTATTANTTTTTAATTANTTSLASLGGKSQSRESETEGDEDDDTAADELLWEQRALAKQHIDDIENLYPSTLLVVDNSQSTEKQQQWSQQKSETEQPPSEEMSGGATITSPSPPPTFLQRIVRSQQQTKRYLIFRPDCI